MKNRRILAVLLALVMVMVSFPVTAFAAEAPQFNDYGVFYSFEVDDDYYIVVNSFYLPADEILEFIMASHSGRSDDICDLQIQRATDAMLQGESVRVVDFYVYLYEEVAARGLHQTPLLNVRAWIWSYGPEWTISHRIDVPTDGVYITTSSFLMFRDGFMMFFSTPRQFIRRGLHLRLNLNYSPPWRWLASGLTIGKGVNNSFSFDVWATW